MAGFSIATYNAGLIRVRLLGRTWFEFAPYVQERASLLSKVLLASGADLCCVQEVFDAAHAQQLAVAMKHSHPYRLFPRTYRPKWFDSGLGLLSRFPLVQSQLRFFKSQLIDEALFGPRAFQSAMVEIPDFGVVEILNAHTTAGGARRHPQSVQADRVRARQLAEMLEFAETRDNAVRATMIVGDLNCGPGVSAANFALLQELGYVDLVADRLGPQAPISWDPLNPLNLDSPHKTSPSQRIDHLFLKCHRGILRARSVRRIGEELFALGNGVEATASDHYGFVAALEIGE
jgi:endonuclease/exonuclease/phosphatase family metal-dependent hydrolase